LFKRNWISIGIDSILTNSTSEGVRYLQLFLKDYTALTGEHVNAGCQKCIATYFNNYVNIFSNMENNSQYQLHKKREGIPLAFGSNVKVTNRNITDKYAEKLIKRYSDLSPDFKISDLFAKFPVQEVQEITAEKKEVIQKPKRGRKSKK
jgi:hypothetical protein